MPRSLSQNGRCAFCGGEFLSGDGIVNYKGFPIHTVCERYAASTGWKGGIGPAVPVNPPLRIGENVITDTLEQGNYVIGTVSWKNMAQWYTVSLLDTYRKLREYDFVEPEYFLSGGLYVVSSRNILVQQVLKYREAVKPEIRGILWIDDDIQWYWDDVCRIFLTVDSNPGAVVGCLYPGREGDMVVGKMADEWDGKTAHGPALFLGFGFTYTPIECFTKTVEYPWFFTDWDRESKAIIGEDVYFCRQVRKAGGSVIGIPKSKVRHAYEPGPRGLATEIRSTQQVKFI